MIAKSEPSMKYDHNTDLRQTEMIKMLESAQVKMNCAVFIL